MRVGELLEQLRRLDPKTDVYVVSGSVGSLDFHRIDRIEEAAYTEEGPALWISDPPPEEAESQKAVVLQTSYINNNVS
jgi:hypothetical protein